MHRTLIVIANASLARLFDRDADNGGLLPLATLQHAESRFPGRELADDRPGHEATDRAGSRVLQPRHDVRRQEHEKDPPVLATVRVTQASDLTSFGLLEIENRLRALHDAQHSARR